MHDHTGSAKRYLTVTDILPSQTRNHKMCSHHGAYRMGNLIHTVCYNDEIIYITHKNSDMICVINISIDKPYALIGVIFHYNLLPRTL